MIKIYDLNDLWSQKIDTQILNVYLEKTPENAYK